MVLSPWPETPYRKVVLPIQAKKNCWGHSPLPGLPRIICFAARAAPGTSDRHQGPRDLRKTPPSSVGPVGALPVATVVLAPKCAADASGLRAPETSWHGWLPTCTRAHRTIPPQRRWGQLATFDPAPTECRRPPPAACRPPPAARRRLGGSPTALHPQCGLQRSSTAPRSRAPGGPQCVRLRAALNVPTVRRRLSRVGSA